MYAAERALDDCRLYLRPDGHWSTDIVSAKMWASQHVADAELRMRHIAAAVVPVPEPEPVTVRYEPPAEPVAARVDVEAGRALVAEAAATLEEGIVGRLRDALSESLTETERLRARIEDLEGGPDSY